MRGNKIGLGRRESGERYLTVLPFGFDRDLTDGTALPKRIVAPLLRISVVLACRSIFYLRFGCLYRCLGAANDGIESGNALIEIHRVHFRQDLPGPNLVPYITVNLIDAAGDGGADLVEKASIDCADTEERRRDCSSLDGRSHDGDRRQRPRT